MTSYVTRVVCLKSFDIKTHRKNSEIIYKITMRSKESK
jgi:hypothetical protein